MISLIVAMANRGVIGKNGELPWHYPADLAYFKKTTLNKTVIFGKKTFLRLIKKNKNPLPQRKIVVVTHDKSYSYPGVTVVSDLLSYLKNVKEDVFVAGGSEIYQQALPFAERLYITRIFKEYDGDTFFPDVNYQEFVKVAEEKNNALLFTVYARKHS